MVCFTTSPSHEHRKLKGMSRIGPECTDLNNTSHMELLSSMNVTNNFSLSLVDTESIRRYMLFLREEIPLLSRFFLKRTLTKLYKNKTKSMKDNFAEITGTYSVTINEWNFGNETDFSRIELHFYNNEIELKK